MSVEEKLQTMEALWQSLSADPAAIESPAWHGEELAERERKIESGESKFVEWEKAKAETRHVVVNEDGSVMRKRKHLNQIRQRTD